MTRKFKIGDREYESEIPISQLSVNITNYIRQLLIDYTVHLSPLWDEGNILSREDAEKIVDGWLSGEPDDEPPIHYAPYGRNMNGLFECGHSTGGYTDDPRNVTCDGCKKKSPGLWPESAEVIP